MENLHVKLISLGLSKEEAKIYLCCLEFGDQAVSSISRITSIGRVNCYHHIDKLVEKGLLSSYQKNGVKIFVSENPKIFINREQEKLNIAEEILPELLSLSPKGIKKPKIQFFEWEKGIKNIFERFLQSETKEIVSFSNFEKLATFFDDNSFLEIHFKERFERGIKTRFISPRTEQAEDFTHKFFDKHLWWKLAEVFLISPKEFYFDSEITIFDDSISIINLNKKNPVWVLIENKELYQTQKAIFDLAWLWATSFIT